MLVQKTHASVLTGFLADLVRRGYRVGEHPLHGGVTNGVHIAGSLHYRGLAADINWGVNGPGERAKLVALIPEIEALGLGLIIARDGTEGAAKSHQNHLHIDCGEWSNYGRGLVHAVGPKGNGGTTQATPPAPASDPRTLQLQQRLNRDYPAYSRLAEDGVYGPATTAVVLEFQTRAGLVRDGIAGPKTRAALGLK